MPGSLLRPIDQRTGHSDRIGIEFHDLTAARADGVEAVRDARRKESGRREAQLCGLGNRRPHRADPLRNRLRTLRTITES